MKKVSIHLLFFLTFCLFACNQESVEDLIPETEETSNEETTDEETPDTEVVSDVPENDIITPCTIDLSSIAPNSTIILDCVLDLKGATITLPANVKVDFEGGDIIGGGKLIFSGGTIDGRLLSDQLAIEGIVSLETPEFDFFASRWGVIEGSTTSAIALQNTAKLENLMLRVKELGATEFSINKFDAFFEVTKVTSTTSNQNFYPAVEAINIPSDFHLKMSDNTFLRMYPAASGIENGSVLAVRNVDNVKVTGGNVIGDRDDRIYSPSDRGLEGTHLFHIQAGRNITINGTKFSKGSSGAFSIYSLGFAFNPEYNPTKTVKIINCTFTDNRRMSIALTDGNDILIEGNTFINTGLDSTNSDGGEVGYAVNIEPVRSRNSAGELIEYQKAFNITVRNNTEKNSRVGFITVSAGQNVTVDNNTIGTRAVYSLVSNTKIINNTFNAPAGSDQDFAIFAAGGRGETVFNNEVAYNKISGYGLGIGTSTKGANIHHNTITNCATGIQISKTFDSKVSENTINVSNIGILSNLTFAKEITISKNEITANGFHIKLTKVNQTAESKDYSIIIDNNNFIKTKKVSLFYANGVVLQNNKINGGIEVSNSSNVKILSNEVTPSESDGIKLSGTHSDIFQIKNNNVTEPTGASRFVCLNNSLDNPNTIINTGNSCL